MSNNMSEEASGQKRQDAPTPLDGVVTTARDAAEGTSSVLGRRASEGLDTALAGMQQVKSRLEEAAHGLPAAPTSTRMAWRAGRWLGRAEGAIWLASRGVGIWWGKAKRRLRRQTPDQRVRLILQWGPSAIASVWLVAQMWSRLRQSAKG